MISAGFGLLQPEAFAARVGRAVPSAAAPDAKESFQSTLQRQSDSDAPALEAPAGVEDAPRDAQESAEAAQESSDDRDLADASEADEELKSSDSAVADEEAETTEDIETAAAEVSFAPALAGAASAAVTDTSNSVKPTAGAESGTQGTPNSETAARLAAELEQPEHAARSSKTSQNAPAPSGADRIANSAAAAQAENINPTETSAPDENIAATASAAVDKKSTTPDAAREGVESARPLQDGVETNSSHRINPVESTSSSPDAALRSTDGRQFIDSLNRAGTQASPGQPSAESSGENRVFEAQVTRGLEAALRQNGGSVTIRLKPETLGAMKIDLQIAQGSVAAQLEATTAEARDLLTKHLATLRTALESKGFNVRSIEIQAPASQSGGEAQSEFGRSFSGQSNAHSHDAQAGSDGHASGRREDSGGAQWNNQSIDALAEDELIEPGWRPVYVNGSLNAVA